MLHTTRKIATAVALTAALIAAFIGPSTADSKDDLEKKRDQASGEVAGAKEDLDASSKKYAAAVGALKTAQRKLDTAQATLSKTRGALAVAKARDQQMQAKLAASEADLTAAVAKLKKGQAEFAASETSVEQFTVDNLQQGDRGMRAFSKLLQGEDPATFSEQMNLNDSVSDAQIATMQRLAATRVILKIKREKVEKLLDQVKVQREQSAANLVTKRSLEDADKNQAHEVGQLVSARKGARSTAAKERRRDEDQYRAQVRERESLNARLRALAAKELAKELAKDLAKDLAKERKKNGSGGSHGGNSGGGATTGGGKGGRSTMLFRPVSGPITSPYGMRVHPVTKVYKLHDGTDFAAACGTPVRAAADGTIIQQYFNGAYGNRVILNNGVIRGRSVVTTYNHLSRFALRAGAKVKRGQVIAYAGTTGYSTGCHLHFMVITNGAVANPMGWL